MPQLSAYDQFNIFVLAFSCGLIDLLRVDDSGTFFLRAYISFFFFYKSNLSFQFDSTCLHHFSQHIVFITKNQISYFEVYNTDTKNT